jgi:hypothetical protein
MEVPNINKIETARMYCCLSPLFWGCADGRAYSEGSDAPADEELTGANSYNRD